jgi:hypothetical protein
VTNAVNVDRSKLVIFAETVKSKLIILVGNPVNDVIAGGVDKLVTVEDNALNVVMFAHFDKFSPVTVDGSPEIVVIL